MRVTLNGRIEVIADVADLNIGASAEPKVFNLANDQLVDYAYIWLAVYPSTYKSFTARVQWLIDTNNAYTGLLDIFSGTTRDISDWFEVKAPKAAIYVKNNHTATEIFKRITLFGVR